MSKHTPTPWVADDLFMEDETYTRIGTTDGTPTYYQRSTTIAECYIDADEGLPDLRAEANAAFIVLAVNSHEALVAALELARDTLYEHGDARYTAPVVERIEAALKSVKGE